jgi:hypothetical protein
MAALDARTDCRDTNVVNVDSGTVRLIEVDVIGKLGEETDADADPALPRRMSAIRVLTLDKPSLQPSQGRRCLARRTQCPFGDHHILFYLPDPQPLSQRKHVRKTAPVSSL